MGRRRRRPRRWVRRQRAGARRRESRRGRRRDAPSSSARSGRGQAGKVVALPRPRWDVGRLRHAPNVDGWEAVDLGAGREARALLDDCSGAHHAAGAEHAAVTDDRSWLDDGSGADATAVDHGPGPTITPSSMMRSLSGSRCKTVFSRIWTSLPMRTGPWESPMILTPAPMIVR